MSMTLPSTVSVRQAAGLLGFRTRTAWLLAVLMLAIPQLAHAQVDLRTHKSRSYVIESDVDQQVVRDIGIHMDMVFREYTKRFSAFPIRNAGTLKLWVFETQDGYASFLRGIGIDATGSGGMFFHGFKEEGLAVFIGERSMQDVLETLRHEGLHQFAYARIHENIPQWANEGLAEYFGYAIETRRGIEPGVVDGWAVQRLRFAIEEERTFPLDELLFMTNETWNQRVNSLDPRAATMYDQSWSVVHFLFNAEGGRYESLLWDFLRAVWQGMTADQAAAKVFSRDLGPMEEAWKAYVAELRSDPLLEARVRLEIFSEALRRLHEVDVRPDSLETMLQELRDRGYEAEYTIGEDGDPIPINAEPEGPGSWWFQFPASLRDREPKVTVKLPRRGTAPPTVEVRGLRQPVTLKWDVARDGTLSHEVVIGG